MRKFLLALFPKKLKQAVKNILFSIRRIRVNERSSVGLILLNNWNNYKSDLLPKDRRMRILSEKSIQGMSTENIRFLINEIVKQYADGGVYLEVGMYQGCSLLSAALYNQSTRCIGIDNFSQFDENNANQNKLKENIAKLDHPDNVEYHNMDYQEYFDLLSAKEPGLKVNVYFYDGEHSYKNQLEGLRRALPFLTAKCIIFVDDINWPEVAAANKRFLRENPDFKSVFKIRTKANGSSDWWNGFEVIARG
jgi:hypothetical protein